MDIGDGDTVHIFKDPWIPCSFTENTPVYRGLLQQTSKVPELFLHGQRKWNIALIRDTFLPHEAASIINTLIIRGLPKTKSFGLTQTRDYTVKSGYHRYEHNKANSSSTVAGASSSRPNPLWKQLWSVRLRPRVLHFLWRAATNCLPIADNLHIRKVCDNVCSICGKHEESLRHCLVDCSITQSAWALIPESAKWRCQLQYSFVDILDLLLEDNDQQNSLRILSIFWCIWKARCNWIFEGEGTCPQSLILHATTIFLEYQEAMATQNSTYELTRLPSKWTNPPHGIYKVNVDRSYKNNMASVGGIFRDENRQIKNSFSYYIRNCQSGEEGEGLTFYHMLTFALSYGYHRLIMEGDCLSFV